MFRIAFPLFVLCFMYLEFGLNEVNGFNVDVERAIKIHGPADSYFGFSAAVKRNEWIIIGAPRASDPAMPNVTEPGAVWVCPLPVNDLADCQPLDIDDNVREQKVYFHGKDRTLNNVKNYQWLGADIQAPSSPDSDRPLSICAHKWAHNSEDTAWYMKGLCYLVPQPDTRGNVKVLPLLFNLSLAYISVNKPTRHSVPNYGFAGLGISAHYLKKTDHILYGAAGLGFYTGGFVDYFIDMDVSVVMTMDPDKIETNTRSHQAGMAMSSGEYLGNGILYYALGIPRAQLSGRVKLFRGYQASYNYQVNEGILKGEVDNKEIPWNSYFGGSLCTDDINKDGLDDLLVGAPLYSDNKEDGIDAGAVLVFIGNHNIDEFKDAKQILVGSKAPRARFGTAIASLYDISKDEYKDIAVGAPYEDEERGVVYIYNGYRRGVWPQYSQRIRARDLGNGLRGFGISISTGVDLNNDLIRDTVVGSYLSDTAVVLHGRPIISVDGTVEVINTTSNKSIKYIEQDGRNATLRLCFHYVYNDCPSINLTIGIDLDSDIGRGKRLFFVGKGSTTTIYLLLYNNQRTCVDNRDQLFAIPGSNFVSPIVIRAQYRLHSLDCQGTKVKPIINQFNGSRPRNTRDAVEAKVEFIKHCTDNICHTDLHLVAKAIYEGDQLAVGESDLTVNIKVNVSMERSDETTIYLVFPPSLSYRQTRLADEDAVECSSLWKTTEEYTRAMKAFEVNLTEHMSIVSCFVINPLFSDGAVRVKVDFDVPSNLYGDELQLFTVVTTASEETNTSDNKQALVIPLSHDINTFIIGTSSEESVYIDAKKSIYKFKHTYDVSNNGSSAIEKVTIRFFVPEIVTGDHVTFGLASVKLTEDSGHLRNERFEWNKDNALGDILVISNRVNNTVKPTLRNQTTDPYVNNNKKNCSEAKCPELVLYYGELLNDNSITVSIEFDATADIRNHVSGSAMTLVSVAVDSISNASISVETKIITEPDNQQEVEWWVPVVSGIGGFIIIAIMVAVLFKVGFFKRQTKEEMQRLLREANKENEYAEVTEPNDEESTTRTEITESDDVTDTEQVEEHKSRRPLSTIL